MLAEASGNHQFNLHCQHLTSYVQQYHMKFLSCCVFAGSAQQVPHDIMDELKLPLDVGKKAKRFARSTGCHDGVLPAHVQTFYRSE